MPALLLGRVTWRLVGLVVFEAALIVGSIALAAWVRLGDYWRLTGPDGLIAEALLIAAITQFCLYYNDLYDMRVVADHRELAVRIIQALGVTSLILAAVYYWFPALVIGRGVFLIAAGFILVAVIAWRLGFEYLTRAVGPRERLLLIGTSPAAVALARELHQRRELGVEVVGFVEAAAERVGHPVFNPGVIGTIDDIPTIVRDRRVDRVVVSLADARGRLPMDKLLEMKLAGGVTFDHLASVYEEYTGKIAIENLRPSWLIFAPGFRKSRALLATKRAVDTILAVALLVLVSPLLPLIALAVRLSSPGPAMYHQARVGEANRLFTIHKFRSMRTDAEAATGAVWASKDDPRITPVGRFLRRTRLDELPQLVNVIRGDMSFVGPRPERPEFVATLTDQIPFYGQRHVIKPGLTGWAQVCYTYGATVEDAMEKLQYDLFYIKHMSLALDAFVVFQTIKTVVLRRGA
jgi:sugar transferase (PEP-CTERM system associated)